MTGRQRQVLEEILAGATQTEIARKMFLDRRVIHRIVEQLVTRGLLRALSKRGQYELTYAGKVVVGQQKAEPIEDDIEQKEEPTDR
jgi:DNA-binding IclR family transcriptional regulator